jgi:hypothetical protein
MELVQDHPPIDDVFSVRFRSSATARCQRACPTTAAARPQTDVAAQGDHDQRWSVGTVADVNNPRDLFSMTPHLANRRMKTSNVLRAHDPSRRCARHVTTRSATPRAAAANPTITSWPGQRGSEPTAAARQVRHAVHGRFVERLDVEPVAT